MEKNKESRAEARTRIRSRREAGRQGLKAVRDQAEYKVGVPQGGAHWDMMQAYC